MTTVDDILAHHGVKGQKWGVRRKSPETRAAKKVARGDALFEGNKSNSHLARMVHSDASRKYEKDGLVKLNNNPKYKDKDFRKDSSLRKEYYKESRSGFIAELQKSASSFGTNPSGTREYSIHDHGDGTWSLSTREVKHADTSVPDAVFDITYNAMGYIVGISPQDAKHSDDFVGDFLEHHGVKGMKWGRHKSTAATEVSVHTKPGEKVKAKGGENQPAHPDAIKAATAKRVAKKSSTDALSTKELQDLVTRMNLEQQYSRLAGPGGAGAAGKKFAADTLVNIGKQQVSRLANEQAAKAIAKTLAKSAARAAVG